MSEAPLGGMTDDGDLVVEEPSEEVRELFGVAFSAAEHFADMLVDEGELRGLVGPRELPRLWSRHLVNSAAVVPFLPSRGAVADVGSGAGFPGIVVANLSKLVRLTAPLLRQGGSLLALKGQKAEAEVEDAKYVIKKAKLLPAVVHEVVTPGDEVTRVVEVRRPAAH